MKCNMKCLECKYNDCINDYVRPEHVITSDAEREKSREYRNKRYKQLRELGLCVDCGKKSYGNSRCMECRIKHNRKSREKYREEHPVAREIFRENGCYFCGKQCVDGKKVCANHLTVCIENADNARKSDKFIEKLNMRKQKYFR